MRRIAIIPARGGSKRIPKKNIRDFCGKPMIAHVLEAIRESRLFDAIHVSTESEEIAATVNALGFQIEFSRPAELADDHTPIMPVLKYVVEEYERRQQTFDQVWSIMACAPLIGAKDFIAANRLFEEAGAERPLLAVAEYPVPVEWAFDREADGKLVPLQPGMFSVRSQDIKPRYFDAGSFAIFPEEMIRSAEGAGSDSGFIGYVLAREAAVDIDDEQDWKIAEAIFNARTEDASGREPV